MTSEDETTARLRRMIVQGDLAPGAKLTVATLARQLGSGVTPVRAALRTLEAEGLVASQAHQGAWVRVLDARDIRNIYRLRAVVLRLLIPDIVRHISNADLDRLEMIEADFEAAAAAADRIALMAANESFHRALVAIAHNPDAAAVMQRSWALVEALRLRLGFGPDRLRQSVESHQALLAALRRRDAMVAIDLAVASSDQAMADVLARAGGAV